MRFHSLQTRARIVGSAFTLVELLVSVAVLVLLLLIFTQMFSGASATITQGNKHMDADAQARNLLDRLSVDFARMVRRADIDYFLKAPGNEQPGNDQFALFSEVPGFYPETGARSPLSLVAYRVHANTLKTQRLGIGLVWNGVSPEDTPLVYLPLTITGQWPAATNMDEDSNYELAAPQVFRMEYYYTLRGQTDREGTVYDSRMSATPWDVRISDHTAVNGLFDVSAITVVIAVIDPKSRVLVTDSQLKDLAGAMTDFAETMGPGDLQNRWQEAIDDSGNGLPRIAASGIRIYSRSFPLNTNLTPGWIPST